MLRCPVSTRYSNADAESPRSASPEIAGLSVDMLNLSLHAARDQDGAGAEQTLDIGQGDQTSVWHVVTSASVLHTAGVAENLGIGLDR
jgi:hypothetical protein